MKQNKLRNDNVILRKFNLVEAVNIVGVKLVEKSLYYFIITNYWTRMLVTMNELSHKSLSAVLEIILMVSRILELVKYSKVLKNLKKWTSFIEFIWVLRVLYFYM